MLTFPSDPTTCGTPPQTTGLASASSENRLSCTEFKSQLTVVFFFSNSKILSASRHDVIHVPSRISYLGCLLWYLWLTHPPRTRVNTCTQFEHLTYPCTKRKVISLTKPKGKIYKTKSLRNYITPLLFSIMISHGNDSKFAFVSHAKKCNAKHSLISLKLIEIYDSFKWWKTFARYYIYIYIYIYKL